MDWCKRHVIRKIGWGFLIGIIVALLILGYIVRWVIAREKTGEN